MIRIILLILFVFIVSILVIIAFFLRYYKKCPAGSILVIFNNQADSFGNKIKIIKSGGAFVWPFGGSYRIFDLKPFILQITPEKLTDSQNKQYYLNAKFILALNANEDVLYKALDRISGLSDDQLQEFATELISGHLRSLFLTLTNEDIESRDKIDYKIYQALFEPLDNIGLEQIKLDIIDLRQI